MYICMYMYVLVVGGVLCDPPVLPVHAVAVPGGVECHGRRGGNRPPRPVAAQHTGEPWVGGCVPTQCVGVASVRQSGASLALYGIGVLISNIETPR